VTYDLEILWVKEHVHAKFHQVQRFMSYRAHREKRRTLYSPSLPRGQ